MSGTFDYEEINRIVFEYLAKEYQSVWIVNAEDMSLEVLKTNKKAIPGSVEKATEMNYAEGISWYARNYIVEEEQEQFIYDTSIDSVTERLKKETSFTIDYRRIYENEVNYNQIFFCRADEEEGDVRFFTLGFRNIDRVHKADYDDLTGVYTRQAFFRRAYKILEENPDVDYDIMVSDIVDFKLINGTYGIKTGDAILAYIGSQMQAENRNGTIIGRYGGDQFVTLIKHDKMTYLAENPDIMLIKPREDLPNYVTKFGIYAHVDHSLPIVSMCDYAHIALNSIKHRYASMFSYYSEEMNNKIDTQRRIEKSMHEALSQDQFKVYYQPKHEAATGKIVGAEALIRWVHPEYGFMSPGEFIPLFEQNGFITETDKYVWKRTCQNLKKWKDEGINIVPVSVNASKLDFVQTDIIKTLNGYVEENDLTPEYIHVEVTESLMEEDINKLMTTLSDIKHGGYKIELDDFGTGYSSINILSTIPIDVVKLDMSFVQQLNDVKRAKVLLACITLAKNLGYKTVSEGVETMEQNELLKDFGVDTIQGYYYSKPLSEEDFEEYLKKNA